MAMTLKDRVAARYIIVLAATHHRLFKLAKSFERKLAIYKLADFSEATVREAFLRAGGRCECDRKSCEAKHKDRCGETFTFEERGGADDLDAWQAHHWFAQSKGGTDDVKNCEILCVTCHKYTASYGRSS